MILIFKVGKYTIIFFQHTPRRIFFFFYAQKTFFASFFGIIRPYKNILFLFFRNNYRINVTLPFLKYCFIPRHVTFK